MTLEIPLFQKLLRQRLDIFVEHAFRKLHPSRPFCREGYLEPLCFALQEAAEAEVSRLLITMPPRMLKSFTAAICLPAFILGSNPAMQIVIATYAEDLAREHMRLFRAIISSRWYRLTFPEFRPSADGKRWENLATTQHGGLRAVTVSGTFTGIGTDLLIIDDLLKAQDAGSEAMREAAMSFYTNTAITRTNDQRRSKIIVVQQRLHLLDIPSQLVERGGYRHLNLPAVLDRDVKLPTYNGGRCRFRAGDLLSPTRYPHEVLDRLRVEMGTPAFSAQFLQEPLPDASMMIDMARLHMVEAPFRREHLRLVVISVDTAVKVGDDCSYSVISTFGFDGVRWCLMCVVRARLDFLALKQALVAQRADWAPDVTIIEETATGEALWQEVGRRDGRTITRRPITQKADRLSVATGRLYSGEIVFPRNEPWSAAVLAELRTFPAGHDDIVDTISQFVGWLNEASIDRLIDHKLGRRPSNPRRRHV